MRVAPGQAMMVKIDQMYGGGRLSRVTSEKNHRRRADAKGESRDSAWLA